MPPLFPDAAFDVVVVAASLGGLPALGAVAGALPEHFAAPVVAVLHRSAALRPYLGVEVMARLCNVGVRGAGEGDALRAGVLHLAPPDRHTVVTPEQTLALSDGPKVNFTRPAADPLFTSAAAAFGPRTLGVVLTGRGSDGTAGAADFALPLETIPHALVGLVMERGTRALFGLGQAA